MLLLVIGPNDRTYPGAVSKPCPGVAVEYNKDAVLKCTLCGFKLPGFSFTWERASGEIAKNRAFTKDCTLVISKVTLQDAGNYTCVARFKSSAVLGETIPLCVKGEKHATFVSGDTVFGLNRQQSVTSSFQSHFSFFGQIRFTLNIQMSRWYVHGSI